jgi:hypothetical protein
MQTAFYYREQAKRARRLSRQVTDAADATALRTVANDLDDIATDLERGAIDIKRPDLMPQQQQT